MHHTLDFIEFFLHSITLLTFEHYLASETLGLLIHVRYLLFQLALVEVVHAHVFVRFPIELGVLLLKNIALDSELVHIVPQRVVLLFGLYKGGYNLI